MRLAIGSSALVAVLVAWLGPWSSTGCSSDGSEVAGAGGHGSAAGSGGTIGGSGGLTAPDAGPDADSGYMSAA
jgi:hypothetical protein